MNSFRIFRFSDNLIVQLKKGIYDAIDGDLLDSDSLSKLNPYMVI